MYGDSMSVQSVGISCGSSVRVKFVGECEVYGYIM